MIVDKQIDVGSLLAWLAWGLGIAFLVCDYIDVMAEDIGFIGVGFMLTGHMISVHRVVHRQISREMQAFELGQDVSRIRRLS